jgi:hypothetical protein
MDDRGGTIRWGRPKLTYGNIRYTNVVVPNIVGKIGRWDENDYHFIRHTVQLQSEPVSPEDVIPIVRPHESRRTTAR